jgi:glutaredoxin
MEQRCHVSAVWLTWLGLPLLALVAGLRAGLVAALAVLVVGIVGQLLYVRWFPYFSRWMGYGSVADTSANPASMTGRLPRVTLYTANVCPFCPIIKRRLADMQRQRQFELEEIDVTFRPDIIRAKGLRSVPALEANGRLLVGNATSAQIAEFLRTAADAPALPASPSGMPPHAQ